MSISNATSSPVLSTGLFGVTPVQGVANFALNTSGNPSPLSSASVVTISALGNFLSAATNLAGNLSQQAGNLPASFDTVIANTQFFVDALNRLVASSNSNSQHSSGASFVSQFMQILNSSTSAAADNGLSIFSNLASIGITLQPPTLGNATGQIQLNPQLLQSAFNANAIGTSSLLGQAFQSIGQLASNLAAQFLQLEMSLAQVSSLQNSLIATSLSNPTTGSTGSVTASATTVTSTPAQPAALTPPTTSIAIYNTAAVTTPAAMQPSSPTPASTAVTATNTPSSVATTTTQNVVSAFNVATDSTTAAAIAAYHLVSGIFDTGKSAPARRLPATSSSQVWPLARVQAVSPS